MRTEDYELIAEVLSRWRYAQATCPIGSVVALVAVELGDAFRNRDPSFDLGRFHMGVQARKDPYENTQAR